jgi:hypothetical protein
MGRACIMHREKRNAYSVLMGEPEAVHCKEIEVDWRMI